jgi:branched-chain amino acid transport system permease protein
MTATTAPPTRTEDRQSATDWSTLRRVARVGLLAGGVMAYTAAVGMFQTFNDRLIVDPILSLGYLVMYGIVAVAGASFSRREEIEGIETEPLSMMDIVRAAIAGAIAGVVVALFALMVDTFPDLRGTFPRLGPQMVRQLTLDYSVASGFIIIPAISAVVAAAGAGFAWIPERIRRPLLLGGLSIPVLSMFEPLIDDLLDELPAITDFLYSPQGALTITSAIVVLVVITGVAFYMRQRDPVIKRRLSSSTDNDTRRRTSIVLGAIVILAVVVLPQFLGGIMNELLTNVGLFALMALGLNVVLGFAGLLDLGYVAFFAVGAYTTGVLTSPLSPTWNPELSWWFAFPAVLVAATIAGIMVGTPVLRMRGDYLAIVTLGFGEIVRLVLLSDWLSPFFGGAQGIRSIPGIPVAGAEVNATSPHLMIYAVLVFVFIAVYISWRLEDSRIGRAWAALREDEDVAEAVGVDTVKAKLLAFVTGAVIASFAGALFAAKLGTVFTTSFQIVVSIIILVIVIVGGMGSLPGVIVGALVLIGILGGPNQPGLLQEFGEYKLLIYGALLVYMMLKRPEGLVPSVRRQRELHQEEFLQDAWLDKGPGATNPPTDGTPSIAEPRDES